MEPSQPVTPQAAWVSPVAEEAGTLERKGLHYPLLCGPMSLPHNPQNQGIPFTNSSSKALGDGTFNIPNNSGA